MKVLDFGLAKSVGADDSSSGHTRTPGVTDVVGGVVVGTPAYMSPEQARGFPVDKRSDIWAFGCLLYEMLTGGLAFAGDTVSDTIAKVLEREPDWRALPESTPVPIRRLLLRCLTKDPKQRLRDIGDARIEIDAIGEALPDAPDPAPTERARRTARFEVAAVGCRRRARYGARRDAGPTQSHPLREPARGRPGQPVHALGRDRRPRRDLTGREVRDLRRRPRRSIRPLAKPGRHGRLREPRPEHAAAAAAGILHRAFGFSADGSEILVLGDGRCARTKTADADDGRRPTPVPESSTDRARLVAGRPAARLHDDPDGARERRSSLCSGRLRSKPSQIIFPEPKVHIHNPIWSPDGQWIYFVRGTDPTGSMDVWRIRPSGGASEQLTHQRAAVNFLAPLDARECLYVARAADWSGPWLWSLDVQTQDHTPGICRPPAIHFGVGKPRRPARRRDGRTSYCQPVEGPIARRGGRRGRRQPYPLPVPTDSALAPRFRGTSLFYLSASGTGDGLWKLQDGQASEVRRDLGGALTEPAAISHDGSRVALVVREGGERHLSVMSADGTNTRTLVPSINIAGAPGQGTADWSPDDEWIATSGTDAQGPGLFKIPAKGGAPVTLVSGQADNPVWSPDGQLIVYGDGLGARGQPSRGAAGRYPGRSITLQGAPRRLSLPA